MTALVSKLTPNPWTGQLTNVHSQNATHLAAQRHSKTGGRFLRCLRILHLFPNENLAKPWELRLVKLNTTQTTATEDTWRFLRTRLRKFCQRGLLSGSSSQHGNSNKLNPLALGPRVNLFLYPQLEIKISSITSLLRDYHYTQWSNSGTK